MSIGRFNVLELLEPNTEVHNFKGAYYILTGSGRLRNFSKRGQEIFTDVGFNDTLLYRSYGIEIPKKLRLHTSMYWEDIFR